MTESAPVPQGVGETALGAAMMRARESVRPDRLICDPYAEAFLAAAPPIFPDGPDRADDPELALLEAAFEEAVVVRTRFFDDFSVTAAGDGCTQVVLVGAGLDTRAFRLDWPDGLRLFELDSPEVLAFKGEVLSASSAVPRCQRVPVRVDLAREEWSAALISAGFNPNLRTAWIVEGVLPYLGNEAARELLVRIGDLSGAGSWLAMDHAGGSDPLLAQAQAMSSLDAIAEMWKGGLAEDVAAWLSERGWSPTTLGGKELAARYPRVTNPRLHGAFLMAQRA